jgi:hypothetical protein
MNTDIDSSRGTVAEFLARSWWLMAIRGLVAVLFGVTAFIAPNPFEKGTSLCRSLWYPAATTHENSGKLQALIDSSKSVF